MLGFYRNGLWQTSTFSGFAGDPCEKKTCRIIIVTTYLSHLAFSCLLRSFVDTTYFCKTQRRALTHTESCMSLQTASSNLSNWSLHWINLSVPNKRSFVRQLASPQKRSRDRVLMVCLKCSKSYINGSAPVWPAYVNVYRDREIGG